MKKIVSSVALGLVMAFFCSNHLQAQRVASATGRTKLAEPGLLVGTNLSRLQTDSRGIDSYGKAGFLVGGFYRINIGNLYFQPELIYSGKGGELSGAGSSERYRVDFHNIDIPLMGGFKIFSTPKANFRVMGGPVASYAVSIQGDLGDNERARDYFRNAQWNVQVGIGGDILFLTMDLRYEWGLNDLRTAKASRDSAPDDPNTQAAFTEAIGNRNLRLHIGIRF